MMSREAALNALTKYEEEKIVKLAESFKVGVHQQ